MHTAYLYFSICIQHVCIPQSQSNISSARGKYMYSALVSIYTSHHGCGCTCTLQFVFFCFFLESRNFVGQPQVQDKTCTLQNFQNLYSTVVCMFSGLHVYLAHTPAISISVLSQLYKYDSTYSTDLFILLLAAAHPWSLPLVVTTACCILQSTSSAYGLCSCCWHMVPLLLPSTKGGGYGCVCMVG